MPNNQNIFLVGPMGVGKTTIGRLLSKRLNRPFYDSDRVVEERTGADIPWIFDVEGEAGFRRREEAVCAELADSSGAVIATGGGIVLNAKNRQAIRRSGFVVYLTASVDQLVERTSKDNRRPLLQTDNPRAVVETLIQMRDPLYREVADIQICTDAITMKQVCAKILEVYENVERSV